MKRLLALLLVLCLALSMAACSKPAEAPAAGSEGEAAPAEEGKTFVGYFWSDPRSSNYYANAWDIDIYLWSMVGGAPLYLNPDSGDFEPGWIDDWSVSEDGMVWTFHISDNAYWQDDVPVTVDDILFSQEYFCNEREKFDFQLLWWDLGFEVVIEKIDEKTFTFAAPFPLGEDALNFWSMPYFQTIPKHIWENIDRTVFLTCDEAQMPIGCGPYQIVEYEPGQYMKFKAHDKFYNGEPIIKDVMMLIIPDTNAATIATETGDINYNGMIEAKDYERLAALEHLQGAITKMYTQRYFKFNLSVVDDINIRKAINYAMDKEAWLNQVYGGVGEILNSQFPHGVQYQDDSILEDYSKRDLAKAKELIEASGYTMGDDGFYQKDGETLEYELLYYSGKDADCLLFQSCMAEAGIKINLLSLEGAQYGERSRANDYEITVGSFGLNNKPGSYSTGTDLYATSPDEAGKLDELWAAGQGASGDDAKAIYQQIDQTINADAIWVFGIQQHSPAVCTLDVDLSEAVPSQTYNFVHWEKLKWVE